jgi:CRP/FNR family transcriptional regulator, cyclic AMP receptor protein
MVAEPHGSGLSGNRHLGRYRRPVADQVFLARLRPSERDALEAVARHRQFGTGQTLFFEGDEGGDVHVLVDGLVKVVMTAASGRQVILGLESAGSILGELSAIDGQPRSASAEAVTPVDVMVLRVEGFRSFLAEQPRVATELLEVVVARLRRTSERQLEFGAGDALARLCSCLLLMIGRFGDRDDVPSVSLPIAQQELADLTGLSREAVVKGLRRLRQLGWVEATGRTIVIRDFPAVEARALY